MLAAPQNHQVMRPANFSNQWLEFFRATVLLEKLAHVPDILNREAPNAWKFTAKVFGKPLYNLFAPSRALLLLYDNPPNIPIQLD